MLDRLKPTPGSRRGRKRLGRGPGSGRGKTATHGVKGQGSRGTGHPVRQGFEGGQMPLNMRVPKKGFTNHFRKQVEIVNLASLAAFGDGETVDIAALVAKGLARGKGALVKVLGDGDAPKNLNVKVNRISAGARKKLEAAGGSVELV
ncbi:MAG: 50S ribosomal protein L15 [Myxococcota bacterium]|jgi:large subunit ribosomal protein L15